MRLAWSGFFLQQTQSLTVGCFTPILRAICPCVSATSPSLLAPSLSTTPSRSHYRTLHRYSLGYIGAFLARLLRGKVASSAPRNPYTVRMAFAGPESPAEGRWLPR